MGFCVFDITTFLTAAKLIRENEGFERIQESLGSFILRKGQLELNLAISLGRSRLTAGTCGGVSIRE
jgi:hypothetical protein